MRQIKAEVARYLLWGGLDRFVKKRHQTCLPSLISCEVWATRLFTLMQHDLGAKNILTSKNNFVIVIDKNMEDFEGDAL
jgi:hypothetical protein